jgi:glycosyltransferase involved in cell wall biosynthesis
MTNEIRRRGKRYVLVTAAYNEENYIENLIKSVVAQVHRPMSWVIVSDGSTDRTDEIVNDYARLHDFIRLYRITEDHPRNFVAQVHAINAGFAELRTRDFEFIGNLDSDITLDPTYFSELLARFELDPRLGLAGGYICEVDRGKFRCRSSNSPLSVAHAIQLFRRECLEQIGGVYVPMPFGGPDWQAEVSARLHSWKVQAFTDLSVYHHRPTGAAAGLLKTSYREGLMDHSLGSHPYFELFRVARRLREKPYVLGAMVRLWAFIAASVRRSARPVSEDFVKFLRKYELTRLKNLLGFSEKIGL